MSSIFDLHNNLKVANALSSQTISTDTDTNGEIVDRAGFHALSFVLKSATITDGAYTVKLQDGDDPGLADAADVPAESVLGSISFADTDDDTPKRIGYIGKKQFVRIVVTSTGTTSGGVFTSDALLAMPLHGAVANQ